MTAVTLKKRCNECRTNAGAHACVLLLQALWEKYGEEKSGERSPSLLSALKTGGLTDAGTMPESSIHDPAKHNKK